MARNETIDGLEATHDGTHRKDGQTDKDQGIVELDEMEYPLQNDQRCNPEKSSFEDTLTESGMKTSNTFNPRSDRQSWSVEFKVSEGGGSQDVLTIAMTLFRKLGASGSGFGRLCCIQKFLRQVNILRPC